MYDDFREFGSESTIFEESELDFSEEYDLDIAISQRRFLGMTAGQRLLITLMLFVNVSIIGLLALVVTQKVWLF